MELDIFKPMGSDLDSEIETLVSKRLKEGLSPEEQLGLDRLVAQRATRMLPARRTASGRYFRVA